MKEIAWQAGVGLASVDRVLHERPGVSPAMRRRVQQACMELERQHQQVGLTGQRVLIDLVMEAPARFSRMVRDTLDQAMQRTRPAVFRAREHLAAQRRLEPHSVRHHAVVRALAEQVEDGLGCLSSA